MQSWELGLTNQSLSGIAVDSNNPSVQCDVTPKTIRDDLGPNAKSIALKRRCKYHFTLHSTKHTWSTMSSVLAAL